MSIKRRQDNETATFWTMQHQLYKQTMSLYALHDYLFLKRKAWFHWDPSLSVENTVYQRDKKEIDISEKGRCACAEDWAIQSMYTYRLNTFVAGLMVISKRKFRFVYAKLMNQKRVITESLVNVKDHLTQFFGLSDIFLGYDLLHMIADRWIELSGFYRCMRCQQAVYQFWPFDKADVFRDRSSFTSPSREVSLVIFKSSKIFCEVFNWAAKSMALRCLQSNESWDPMISSSDHLALRCK